MIAMLITTMTAQATAASLTVTDPEACLDVAALTQALSSEPATISVSISERSLDVAQVALAATRSDGQHWSRTLSISAADCPYLAPLVTRSVTQGLAAMPELPDAEPIALERSSELRSWRAAFGLPAGFSGDQAWVGARFGVQWDSGVTLSQRSMFSGERDSRYRVSVVYMLTSQRFQPEVTVGGGGLIGGAPVAAAGLWLPLAYRVPQWSSDLLVGPSLTVERSLLDGTTSGQVGLSVVIRADHTAKR